MAGQRGPARRLASWHEPTLVGRDGLVAELSQVASLATKGAGGVVIVSGEAGIGKTTLVRAVLRTASDGVAVTWGYCPANRSAPPFWPWRRVLDVGPDEVDEPDGPETAIGWSRFERLNVFRDQLLDRPGPWLHVIEDLQWADVASVLLLAHLGEALADRPIVVVATVRTGEPTSSAWTRAIEAVDRIADRYEVPGLSAASIDELLVDAGIEPGSSVARLVHTKAAGNALFATELIRATRTTRAGSGALELAGEIPTRVADLVRHRLDRLPVSVADTVVTASVVGGEGSIRTLAALDDADVETIVDRLEQARAAHLLDAAPPGRWRFRHALVRDAVYSSTTDGRRARLHAAILDVLAADARTPPPILAHHALAAQPLLDGERAVALAARAGESAFDHRAYEEAIDWFDRAVTVAGAGVAHGWRAELLVRSGEAHRHLGEIETARRVLLEASDLTDDPDLLARAALGYADPGADLGIAYRTDDPVTAPLLERAIAAQPAGDHTTTVLLEARLAAELYFSDDPDRGRRLAVAALDRAHRVGDRRALGVAAAVHHDALVVGQAPLDAQLAGSAALLVQARRTRSASALLTAHRARVFDLLAAADLPGVDTEMNAFRRIAEPLQAPAYLWWPSLWSAMRALHEGRHRAAEEAALQAHELGRRPFPALALVNLSFLLFFLRREQGRLSEFDAATREYAASHADIPAIRVALALLLAETGRRHEAHDLLEAIAAHELDRLHDRNWPASWFQLARSAYLVGARDLAARLLDDGHRPGERCVMVSLATVSLGATDLALAWLLHATGDLDAADAAYHGATEANLRMGARSWAAQARTDHAELLVARGDPPDREGARPLIALARRATDEIGLDGLRPTLDRLEVRLGSTRPDDEPVVLPAGTGTRATGTFRRSGPTWDLEFAGRRVQLSDRRGLRDLSILLARPHQAVAAVELLAEGPQTTRIDRGALVLDDRARREIRDRLRELDEEEAEAEANHDLDRASDAREQRQRLAEIVARDLGLGGRSRRIGDDAERARKTVSTRIRRTIAAVASVHPELGRHLQRSIDTGSWCAYRPAEPTTWTT